MIRINLIPVSKTKQLYRLIWEFAIFLIFLIVIIIVLFVLHTEASKEREAILSKNDEISSKIKSIEKQIADHDTIKAKIEKIEKRREIIRELQERRTGPAYFLMELSNILSRGKGPHIDPDKYAAIIAQDKTLGYNYGWDNRRLWLTSIEEENREVELKGAALTTKDLSEFIRRLELSDFFYNVELVESVQKTYEADKLIPIVLKKEEKKQENPTVTFFQIHCKVRYGTIKQESKGNKKEEKKVEEG